MIVSCVTDVSNSRPPPSHSVGELAMSEKESVDLIISCRSSVTALVAQSVSARNKDIEIAITTIVETW